MSEADYMHEEGVSGVDWMCSSIQHVEGIVNGLLMTTACVNISVRCLRRTAVCM